MVLLQTGHVVEGYHPSENDGLWVSGRRMFFEWSLRVQHYTSDLVSWFLRR